MDCMVTGGAGFIGSHVVDALMAQGCKVSVLDDLSTGRRQNINATVALTGAICMMPKPSQTR
jgi:UDP-glucose 4-epimerase